MGEDAGDHLSNKKNGVDCQDDLQNLPVIYFQALDIFYFGFTTSIHDIFQPNTLESLRETHIFRYSCPD